MHRLGHYGAALIAYAPVGGVTLAAGFRELAFIGAVGVIPLAMVPDWDQRAPGIAHRGVTHTVHFAALVGGILALAGFLIGTSAGIASAVFLSVFGFAVGFGTMLSHIAADALTPMGVEPFRNGKRYSLDLVKAANPVANFLLFGLGILTVAAVGWGGVVLEGLI